MLSKDFLTREALVAAFPDENACLLHLHRLRWPDQIVSPFDENSKVYLCAHGRYRCRTSGKYFNVKTNTIFHNSRIALQTWFIAIWMVSNSQHGISSAQLGRELQLTQKTAWFMLQRIKSFYAMEKPLKPRVKLKLKPIETKKTETIEVLIKSDKMKMTDWLSQLKK